MIKVAIYEDNTGLREVLATLIRESEETELAGEFGHCLDVIQNTRVFNPDVIIMDIDMPGKSGIEGVKEVKSAFPEIEIIMNTVFDDDERIFLAVQAGATGYLLKKSSLSQIISSIVDVKKGGAPMSPTIARKVLSLPFANFGKTNESNDYNLSKREYEILELLSNGFSYKMIANEINLSIDTIRTHIKKIYEKLHVNSATEAINMFYLKNKT
ncbi:MAG: response regulator transcription factor [Saprospiraceae bacterium]|nr:response regulator transcription factor [Saprospiraceae bacterium]